eukprot:gnl/TRDRNA2_/TRDRNA2_182120_c0_seq1.p1 gnl/TRDRNA2_/TRDRNA2_182120_c0~~gnl/TRDRNA2_/TRDRNA2_182120_c0_seq1.p1  ORF type:complete len:322 (+),score=77.05 gnl/TRDRNA2_/TRDRNA2_182120_c0_seq1:56-967(+)
MAPALSNAWVFLVLSCAAPSQGLEAQYELGTSLLQAEVQTQMLKGVASGMHNIPMSTCKAPQGPLYVPEAGTCDSGMAAMQKQGTIDAVLSEEPEKAAALADMLYKLFIILAGAAASALLKQATNSSPEDEKLPAPARGELIRAASNADAKICQELLDRGAKPNEVDSWGRTTLHFAAAQGSTSVAGIALDSGIDVNMQDGAEETPLHIAARTGEAAMCTLLLKHGAAVNMLNAASQTPLLLAAHVGHKHVCKVLLEHGGGTGGVADEKLPALLSSLMVQTILSDLGMRPPVTDAVSESDEML